MKPRYKVSQPQAADAVQKTEYRMGRRLDVLKYTAVVIIAAISFVFYFIYDFVFSPVFPALAGLPLVLLFLAADLALVGLDFLLIKKFRAGVFYRVCPDGLEYVVFGKSNRYLWTNFSQACYGRISPGVVCPVTFTVQGRELRLNPYTEKIWDLSGEILRRIKPYAKLEPELLSKVEAMSGL